eukprot:351237-Chlamydomonas_euryale.AAC.4
MSAVRQRRGGRYRGPMPQKLVYRGRLAGSGEEVAIKVQRPGVVSMIAMDVYILRYLAAAARAIGKFNTDLPALVDEWATSLFKVWGGVGRCGDLPCRQM